MPEDTGPAEDAPIAIYGAGAIGLTVGGWLVEAGLPVRFLARGTTLAALRERGLTLEGADGTGTHLEVEAGDDPASMLGDAGIVVLAVKNYSLAETARTIATHAPETAITVALQNGVANQAILPHHLQRIVYGIVTYNAWVKAPAVVGCQRQGPLVLGVLDPALRGARDHAVHVLGRGVPTVATDRFRDAAWCKLVINLTNSLTTLLGFGHREIADRAALQRVLSGQVWEGVRVLRAAGIREVRLPGLPPWWILWAGGHLPRLVTRPLFERNVRKMVISSMGQDVEKNAGTRTELEDLNGEILRLARAHGVATPINQAVYELCVERFGGDEPFTPVTVAEVETRVRAVRDRVPGGAG